MPPVLCPACAEAVPELYQCSTGDVGRSAPVLFRAYTKPVPGLYRCCDPTGAVLGPYLGRSDLYSCCTKAVPGPCRGDTGQVHSACSDTSTGLVPGWKHCCSGLYRVCTGELSRGCIGAAPELYRSNTEAVPAKLHGCPLLVSVLVLFPFQRLSFSCWCAGTLVVSAVVLVLNKLWLSWCSFGGCPSNVSAVAVVLLLPLSLCYCGSPFPGSVLPKQSGSLVLCV